MNMPSYRTMLSFTLTGLLLIAMTGCEKKIATVITPLSSASGSSVDATDIELAAHIRSALVSDGVVTSVKIDVVVTKGDARLTGEVETQQQLDQILKVAKSVEGVHTIHDELFVKK